MHICHYVVCILLFTFKPRIPRELRVCFCGNDVKTLRHVFLDWCIVAQNNCIMENAFTLSEFFIGISCTITLIVSKTLKI